MSQLEVGSGWWLLLVVQAVFWHICYSIVFAVFGRVLSCCGLCCDRYVLVATTFQWSEVPADTCSSTAVQTTWNHPLMRFRIPVSGGRGLSSVHVLCPWGLAVCEQFFSQLVALRVQWATYDMIRIPCISKSFKFLWTVARFIIAN